MNRRPTPGLRHSRPTYEKTPGRMNNPRAFEKLRITADATGSDDSTTEVHKGNRAIAGLALPLSSHAQKAAVRAVGQPLTPRVRVPFNGRGWMDSVRPGRRCKARLPMVFPSPRPRSGSRCAPRATRRARRSTPTVTRCLPRDPRRTDAAATFSRQLLLRLRSQHRTSQRRPASTHGPTAPPNARWRRLSSTVTHPHTRCHWHYRAARWAAAARRATRAECRPNRQRLRDI
jgi:hypothetical protein